jgi:hypothetical protein
LHFGLFNVEKEVRLRTLGFGASLLLPLLRIVRETAH